MVLIRQLDPKRHVFVNIRSTQGFTLFRERNHKTLPVKSIKSRFPSGRAEPRLSYSDTPIVIPKPTRNLGVDTPDKANFNLSTLEPTEHGLIQAKCLLNVTYLSQSTRLTSQR